MHSLFHGPFLFLSVIVIAALLFDFINGFHDTANAIATVVSTRVLTPVAAILMAGVINFIGALASTKVATTVAKGIITSHAATQDVILAAVLGAIVWNLITWWQGIPSSSSHALFGGLIGAGFVSVGTSAIQWMGVFQKVIIPMIISPLLGGVLAFGIMSALFYFLRNSGTIKVSRAFHPLQMLSAAAMAFSHGLNDAQKSMGIILLALITFHVVHAAPGHDPQVPLWTKLACATAMGCGTAAGGWRIMRTMGQRITRLEPIHGFAAETAASVLIYAASHFGMPVSTTHVISGSIFGVGVAKRSTDVQWNVAQRMVMAWIVTLPAAAISAAIFWLLVHAVHHG